MNFKFPILACVALCVLFLGTNGRGQKPAGRIDTAGVLADPRAAHTATLLDDGRVLIAGGFTTGVRFLATTEIFDPASGAIKQGASLATARSGHTATRLADGRVLIAGGFKGDYLASAEIFDPRTGKFAPTGRLTTARSEHAAVLLRDGKVLLIGGVGNGWTFLAESEIFDPATGRFTPTGAMTTPRESHTATLLADGRVLVTGGHRGRRAAVEIFRSTEIYDPRSGAFKKAAELGARRHKHDAVKLPDGRVLIVGGSDERDSEGAYDTIEIYDPRSDAFAPAGFMARTRYKLNGTTIVLGNGKVLIAGGARQAEVYDPATKRIEYVGGDFDGPRLFATATLLKNGRVLIAGGYDHRIVVGKNAWLFSQ